MRETRATGLSVQGLTEQKSPNARERALRLAAIAVGIGLAMTVINTARAGDDDDNRSFSEKIVDDFKGVFKTTNMESKGIDYRERSPLVVPPQLDLPPPAAAAADVNAPNWPRDPDEKRRKAAEAARKKNRTSSTHELTPAEAEAARASAAAGEQAPSQQGFMDKFSGYFSAGNPEIGQFKGEPTRETLIQPPPGYQIPSSNYAYGVGLKQPRNRDNNNSANKDSTGKQ